MSDNIVRLQRCEDAADACTLKSRNISSFCIIIASIEPRFNFSIDVLPHIIAAFHLITQYLISISTSTLHFRLHSTSERIRSEGEPFKVKRCTSILCKPHAPQSGLPEPSRAEPNILKERSALLGSSSSPNRAEHTSCSARAR